MLDKPMSDDEFRAAYTPQPDPENMSPDQTRDFLERLTPVPTTPEQDAQLLAMLPPAGDPSAPLTVVRSLRLPEELSRRVEEAAEAENIPTSAWIRRAIESALAGRIRSNLVSLDDVLRAIASVPKAAA